MEGEGNAVPAPGRGVFRLALPLRPDEPRTGSVRFGFGAMRKKPSLSLCRARVPLAAASLRRGDSRGLSVLKNRPMPFFLYHVPEGKDAPFADKINGARITFRDDQGDCVLACALWGDRSWAAHNITMMELKDLGAPAPGVRASEYYHSGDRETFLRTRAAALALHPLPRTFEGFVFGPSGSVAEYCFLVLRIRDGALVASWENAPSGRNWEITL